MNKITRRSFIKLGGFGFVALTVPHQFFSRKLKRVGYCRASKNIWIIGDGGPPITFDEIRRSLPSRFMSGNSLYVPADHSLTILNATIKLPENFRIPIYDFEIAHNKSIAIYGKPEVA